MVSVVFKHKKEKYFTPTIRALFHIVNADGLPYEGQTELLFRDSFPEITSLFSRHRIMYHLFMFLQKNENLLSAHSLSLLRERISRQAVRSLEQLGELIIVCRNLNQAGLKYTAIKGPHLARMLYGNSVVKVSVDLDLLMINHEDLAGFRGIFSRIGFECFEGNLLNGSWMQKLYVCAKREIHFYNRNTRCTVDLHAKPLANTIITRHRFNELFSDLQYLPFEGITIPVFPPEKYFVYLCHHGACHRFERLGWLLDIRSFYHQQKETMDPGKILSVAASLNILQSVFLAFYLLEGFFNDPVPDFIRKKMNRSAVIDSLAVHCLKAICREAGKSLSIGERFRRIYYLMRLTRGFAGKTDVVISVILRHLARWLLHKKTGFTNQPT